MRKQKIIALLLLAAGIISTRQTFAQDKKTTVVINAGTGLSFMSSLLVITDSLGGNLTTTQAIPSPVLNAGTDILLSNNFSYGVALSYQSIKIQWHQWYDSTTGQLEDFNETMNRINFGGRFLYHFVYKPRFDAYGGLRVGYSYWWESNTSQDPAFEATDTKTLKIPTFQLMVGAAGYITPNVGLHIETGLGTPYYVEGGISVKFSIKGHNENSDGKANKNNGSAGN